MGFNKNDRIESFSDGTRHESAGGFVFFESKNPHELFVALLQKSDGSYVIPKGHLQHEEHPKDAAIREVKEELCLSDTPKVISYLGTDSYTFALNDKDIHYKVVHLYAFKLLKKLEIKPLRSEGFEAAYWLPFEEALRKITFDKKNLLSARQYFYNYEKLENLKRTAIGKLKEVLGDNLLAVIISGSASSGTYKDGWSDLDLLIIVNNLDFDTKRLIATVVNFLEKKSSVHHGITTITKEESVKPISPEMTLDGKTLQTMVSLRKSPENLLYSKTGNDSNNIYLPNEFVIKTYSLSNIGMFLRRNRQTLTRIIDCSTEELKEMLKKEMRAAVIIIKLAVQYRTGIPQEDSQKILSHAKVLFPTFEFKVIEENSNVIAGWENLNDKDEINKIFRRTDRFIEEFTHYVFAETERK
jgi:8-oxo-dGTP pyrophosphatase MutT (NUDIX family)